MLCSRLVECDGHLGEVINSEGRRKVVSSGEEDTEGGVVKTDLRKYFMSVQNFFTTTVDTDLDSQEPAPTMMVSDAELEGVHLLYLESS